jgi:hypothetical protein
MRPRGPTILKVILAGLIAWGLWLPLDDLLTYPGRVSVLPNLAADAEAYHDLARELSLTWHNNIPAKFPPLWIGLMASVYSMSGVSFVAGKLISWAGLVICVSIAAWLARRVHGPWAGWAAAVLCATSAGLRAYVGTLQYEIVTAAWLLVAVALTVRALNASSARSSAGRLALAGIAGALLILTRETFVVAVVILALWIAQSTTHSAGRRTAFLRAAIYLAVALSLPLEWAVVQSVREGRLIPVTEKGPKEFALGNHPTANGTYNEPLVGMAEPAGIPFIRHYPGRAMALFGRKALYFWGVLRDGWTAPQPMNVWIWRASMGWLPLDAIGAIARGGWLLAAFLLAIWWLGRGGLRTWWALPAIVVAVWAIHVISLSSFRFGVPTLPLTYVIVSGPIAAFACRTADWLRAPIAAIGAVAIGAIVLLAQFQSWPLQVTYAAADLDGLLATNDVDSAARAPVRVADAARGVR